MQSVPTFIEAGYPDIRGSEMYGIFAPPGTPPATVEALHDSMVSASRDPALIEAFEQVGLESTTLPPPEFARLIQRERDAWGPVVRASGFRFEE
jgi:tripartite-type tricarboxylate transporter receptor subunit TctC